MKRRLRNVLLALGLGLAAAEVGIRLLAKLTLRGRAVVHDSEIGWRYLPNVRKVGRYWSHRVPARTNARGWGDDASFERTPGVRRIVALGDSFTFGVMVDHGERFSELLERDVARLEVLDLGMNAVGTDRELRVLEVEGVRHAPDVVLLGRERDASGPSAREARAARGLAEARDRVPRYAGAVRPRRARRRAPVRARRPLEPRRPRARRAARRGGARAAGMAGTTARDGSPDVIRTPSGAALASAQGPLRSRYGRRPGEAGRAGRPAAAGRAPAIGVS